MNFHDITSGPDILCGYGKFVLNRRDNCAAGLWARLLPVLAKGARGKLRLVDATHIKVHQHGSNPRGGQSLHAIGRTKGGLNSKLHAVVDGKGRPLALVLTAGQVHELRAAPEVLGDLRSVIIIADKACDSDELARLLAERDCRICVPAKSNRRRPLPFLNLLKIIT